MGTWGEGPLDNDTAGDLEVFWQDYVVHGRSKDPRFWTATRIAELFRFLYFKGYENVHPERPAQAEELLALGALFRREKLDVPPELMALVESGINYELRRDRLQEWADPAKRKQALENFLREIGGKRKQAKPKRRPPSEDIAEIETFMKRAPHWIAVVKGEEANDAEYDALEPQFIEELKRFCFAGTRSEDTIEQRRAVMARLKCLGYFTGWMLNLPSEQIVNLVNAAREVASPAGPEYAWAAEIFAS